MGGGYVGGQPARPASCILCSLATSESRQVFRPSGQKWQKNMNAKQAIQKCIYQRKQLNFSHLMNISRLLALWRLTSRYCTFFLLPVVGIVRRRARRRIPQFGRIIYCLEKASTAPLASSLAPTHSSNEKCGKLLSLISGNRTARLPFLHPVFIPPYFDNTYFIFTRTCNAQTERQKGSELRRYTDRGKVVARNGKKRMSCGRKGGHNMRGQPAIY